MTSQKRIEELRSLSHVTFARKSFLQRWREFKIRDYLVNILDPEAAAAKAKLRMFMSYARDSGNVTISDTGTIIAESMSRAKPVPLGLRSEAEPLN